MEFKNFNLLKKISETPGVSGFEKEIRNLIIREITPFVDSVSIDNMGNVTGFRKGKNSKKLMLAAHMDEIGFIVNHIDDKGFLRFFPLGGFDPKTIANQRVVVHGKTDLIGVIGSKPIHLMDVDERGKKVEIKNYFIDLGMSKEEVEKVVEIGTPVTRFGTLIEMGECLNGKSLDNRISVFILIEAMKELHNIELPYDTFAVFTVQEEVGLRGSTAATLEIQPDFALAIDTTIAYDTPGAAAHESVTKLGDGTAIKIMDSGTIADFRMIEFMKQTAKSNNIKYQVELLPAGGTDTARMQQFVKNGSIAGAVSVPTRHIHQVIESVHNSDVIESIKLLKACVLEIGDWDFRF